MFQKYPSIIYIRSRLNSLWKVGLEFSVLFARVLMSSREQSREIRTNSQRAPPLIMSFAFTSEMWKFKPYQGGCMKRFRGFQRKVSLPCCAKWQSASSMCRLIGEASLLAFCTIHGSAPSSISSDLPFLVPVAVGAEMPCVNTTQNNKRKQLFFFFFLELEKFFGLHAF